MGSKLYRHVFVIYPYLEQVSMDPKMFEPLRFARIMLAGIKWNIFKRILRFQSIRNKVVFFFFFLVFFFSIRRIWTI